MKRITIAGIMLAALFSGCGGDLGSADGNTNSNTESLEELQVLKPSKLYKDTEDWDQVSAAISASQGDNQ